MMNKYRIIFSPTGGTEKVSKSITKNWGHVEDIDLTIVDKDYYDISLSLNNPHNHKIPVFMRVTSKFA